ncbi:MAG: hypothetical protein K0Q93_1899 [Nocardioidaceae bacterium]|nr:hypothetical protein [Nocardioidaceae bacterium]
MSARVGTADSVHILVAWLTWSCALRDRLQAVLADPQTIPRDLAAVSREYWMTLDKLAEIEPSSGTSPLDEIAARRHRGAS